MTLDSALASVRITQVWAALGGGPLRFNRGRAFWRNGDGYNIGLNDDKGVWRDFTRPKGDAAAGGGILDLIQVALGCDRAGAVRWLAETFGLQIDTLAPLSLAEKQRYARARSEAERFVRWRAERDEELRIERDFHLRRYHEMRRLISKHSLEHPGAEKWAEACEFHERQYQALDDAIDQFRAADVEALIPEFQKSQPYVVSRRIA